jgi:hypothetical protein
MNEFIKQISENAALLSVFLFTAAIFLCAFAWACVAFLRMHQIVSATNLTISRELSLIQHSLAAPNVALQPIHQESLSTVPGVSSPKQKQPEGEAYGYNDDEMAAAEAVRILRSQHKFEGGMTDDELEARFKDSKSKGFNEDEL